MWTGIKALIIVTAIIVTGLSLSAVADQQTQSTAQERSEPLKTTADELPEGIRNFNGMLVGRLAAKDVEKGTFLVTVDAVPRVWRNSKAEDPKSIVGKTVEVGGVFGKFLDVLVVMKKGETLEFEARHDGDRLTFPGELLRKVAPYKPEDYPVLPEGFRGFHGAVLAEIVRKDPETFELIVEVDRVTDVWKANQAETPKSIEGQRMMLAGFWQRKEAYHALKVGERIEVGLQHRQLRSDHVSVAEFVRRETENSPKGPSEDHQTSNATDSEPDRGVRGFRGMLVGRLQSRDVERGTFTVEVDAVPRVWKNNKASNPKHFIGQVAKMGGVAGKMLDVLVVTRPGETIEFGVLDEGGEHLRVVELLRKVAPVQPGDYPELPDQARGVKGLIIARVVRKDAHLLQITAEVRQIKKTFPGSSARDAESLVGKNVMLAGFWQRKEAFHDLEIGDLFECGVEHPLQLSDHLSVIETVTRIEP